jgi:mono/diheme cytochrome c family protein
MALVCAAAPLAAQAPDAPVVGAFAEEQATRGSAVFGSRCIECHARPDISSPDFKLKWNGRTAFDLYERMRTTMPDGNPGTYGPQEYLDVLAYYLKANGLPSGGVEFTADTSVMARIVLKFGGADVRRAAFHRSYTDRPTPTSR